MTGPPPISPLFPYPPLFRSKSMGRTPRWGPALAVEDEGDAPSRHIRPPGPEVLREPEIKPRRGAEHALVDPAIEIGTAGVIGGAAGGQGGGKPGRGRKEKAGSPGGGTPPVEKGGERVVGGRRVGPPNTRE